MPNSFFYSIDALGRDGLRLVNARGYRVTEATDDPDDFWTFVNNVEANTVVAIMTHGDGNGMLMIGGTAGDDMTPEQIELLGHTLVARGCVLLCCSCHTGNNPFWEILAGTGVVAIAPRGFAVVEQSANTLSVVSSDKMYSTTAGYDGLFPRWRPARGIPL